MATGCRKPPEGSHALPGGFTSLARPTRFGCHRVRRLGFDLSLSPPRGLRGGPALSSEPLRLRPATPQPAHLRTEHPLASLPEFKASLAPARQSGFATAPPTTCSQGTRSPKPRQLFRRGFGYLKSEPRPKERRYNELARNPPRNPHGFQQDLHNGQHHILPPRSPRTLSRDPPVTWQGRDRVL